MPGYILAPKGGYTRIIKTGFRPGDAAEMAMIELVDFNEGYTQNKNTAKATEPKKKTRRAGGKKAAGTTTATTDETTGAKPAKKAAAKKKKAADTEDKTEE